MSDESPLESCGRRDLRAGTAEGREKGERGKAKKENEMREQREREREREN